MLIKLQKFLFDNKYTLGLFLVLLFRVDDVLAAADGKIFGSLVGAGRKIAEGITKIIYPAATIGIASVCIGGMFGNFNWKWLAAILIGVFIIAYSADVGEIATSDMDGGS